MGFKDGLNLVLWASSHTDLLRFSAEALALLLSLEVSAELDLPYPQSA